MLDDDVVVVVDDDDEVEGVVADGDMEMVLEVEVEEVAAADDIVEGLEVRAVVDSGVAGDDDRKDLAGGRLEQVNTVCEETAGLDFSPCFWRGEQYLRQRKCPSQRTH